MSARPTACDSTAAARASPWAAVRFATAAIGCPASGGSAPSARSSCRPRRSGRRARRDRRIPAAQGRRRPPEPRRGFRRSPSRPERDGRREAPAGRDGPAGARSSRLESVSHLPEDLALARHERVETGRHPEQVQRGTVVTEPVEQRARARRIVAGEREQGRGRSLVEIGSVVVARKVELCPVAGRENDCLTAVRELAGRARRAGWRRRRPAPAARRAPGDARLRRGRVSRGEVGQREDDGDEREAGDEEGGETAAADRPSRRRSRPRRRAPQIVSATAIGRSKSPRSKLARPTTIPAVSTPSEISAVRAESRSSVSSGGRRSRSTPSRVA